MGISTLLRKLLPPENELFYGNFDKSAAVCAEAAKVFQELLKGCYTEAHVIRVRDVKHRSGNIARDILNLLSTSFVTPFDREDIQQLAFHMNKITKRIVRGCVNLRAYNFTDYPPLMHKQAETLVAATQELCVIVALLRKTTMKELTQSHGRIAEIETHGDDLLYQATTELYSGKVEALEVIKRQDIYRSIENALDYCNIVAEEVVNVVLKHG